MVAPPANSNIRVESADGNDVIVIPQGTGGFFRYFAGAFMLFWLAGWAMGWAFGAWALFTGESGPRAFVIFWMAIWTAGGVFVMYLLYRLFRRAVPETIVLASPEPLYDSGITPFRVSFGYGSPWDAWRRNFRKRRRTSFSASELATLKLRDFATGNRLTIDQGIQRLDLALSATEPEREWLYGVLKSHYRL